jgi:hypothetical protein
MNDDADEPFYFDEVVIGSMYSYHRSSCHIIQFIRERNYKRLRGWEEAVDLGLNPCPHCRPPWRPPATCADDDKGELGVGEPLTARSLGDLRRDLLRMLDAVEVGYRPPKESLAARIGRLSKADVLPRHVAACMRTVTEMRNVTEYEAKAPSQAESRAVRGAWLVIIEWATERRIPLASLESGSILVG